MNHLLETVNSQASTANRADAFLSMGKLCLAVGIAVARKEKLLENIAASVREGLREQRKKEQDTQREALACLRMMSEAVGPALTYRYRRYH